MLRNILHDFLWAPVVVLIRFPESFVSYEYQGQLMLAGACLKTMIFLWEICQNTLTDLKHVFG